MHDSVPSRGVWGDAPPEIFGNFRHPESAPGAFSDL